MPDPLEIAFQNYLVVTFRAFLVVGCVDLADQLLDILFIKLTQRLTYPSCYHDKMVDVFDRSEPAVALGDHVVN